MGKTTILPHLPGTTPSLQHLLKSSTTFFFKSSPPSLINSIAIPSSPGAFPFFIFDKASSYSPIVIGFTPSISSPTHIAPLPHSSPLLHLGVLQNIQSTSHL